MASSGGLAIAGMVANERSGRPVARTLVTIFHRGHDIFPTGPTVEPGRDVADLTIVVARSSAS